MLRCCAYLPAEPCAASAAQLLLRESASSAQASVLPLQQLSRPLLAALAVLSLDYACPLLLQRGKLEMEELFRDVVPERNRLGTRVRDGQGGKLGRLH